MHSKVYAALEKHWTANYYYFFWFGRLFLLFQIQVFH